MTPHAINHRLISNGYYGPAVYLAFTFDDAEAYTTGWKHSHIKVVGEYEVDEGQLLSLSNDNISNLHHFSLDPSRENSHFKLSDSLCQTLQTGKEIHCEEFASICVLKGYSGLKLTGRVEGGEQVVIPYNSNLAVNLVATHVGVWIFDSHQKQAFRDAIEHLFNQKVTVAPGEVWFRYTPEESGIVEELLNFHQKLGHNVMKVDYINKTVEYYDED